MAAEGNPICGGVMLLHTERKGKHSYEVNGFFNYNKGNFASIGDKVLMINNTDVEDLIPQAFAELLAEGCPLLTIHHSSKMANEKCESEEIVVRKKEPTVMRFSMMMVREEELEATEVQPSLDWEDRVIEDDCFSEDNLLLVSMAETSFSVVVGRGCDPDSPCNSCGGMNCQFNEVVVLPATAEITFNSSRILMQIKQRKNLFLQSFLLKKYVTPENQHMLLKDTMSAQITLYYYTITMDHEGVPVVLNCSGTENFFCCTTKQGEDKKILTVTSHNKKDLKSICPDDREKWSLVFFMSSGKDNLRRFESALYRGWFIYTERVNNREVDMHKVDQLDSKKDGAFSFIILSERGSLYILYYCLASGMMQVPGLSLNCTLVFSPPTHHHTHQYFQPNLTFWCTTHNFLFLPHESFDIRKSSNQRQSSHIVYISTEINMEVQTVCHMNTEKTEECQPETSSSNKKMLKFMRFSLSIEDTEPEESSNPKPEKDTEDEVDHSFHSRTTMCLNLIDQECDADNLSCKCDLISNDSKITAETANIAYISEQIWKVIKEQNNLFLKTPEGCKYVASKQNEICLENTMSAKITIFHGTFLGMVPSDKNLGVPVMLKFTDTNKFLCCTSQGDEMILSIKVYDVQKIHLPDPEKSLIFFMSQKCDGLRYFESALHRGWFIHTINDNVVKMKRDNETSSSCFVLE
ncbi:uncharacterized protein LOC122353802 [Puntigrus tetrazona]|uniref:uncharacterized protein LOC122353802 n=1 Tax=Puntigrus tetrazona TaxID=1606681 RepID=UPI001C8AD298|nr:uncharacterized protein LOC122353802 [Puntigrus tetrazona]